MRRPALLLTLLISCAASAALAGPAAASDFHPAAGDYTVNTTTLKLTGPGPTNITGVNEGGVAVFRFDDVDIPSSVTIIASGVRPFKLVASGNLALAGVIASSGTDTSLDFADGPFAGGAGGGAGGATTGSKGGGPGGGGAGPTGDDGGGGGGFGGKGARGGKSGADGATTGVAAGGAVYGDLNGPLQGGSGGAGGASVGGAGGGGAIALFGQIVTIASGAEVIADGGAGAVGDGGASGGGSGGGIVVHGDTVDVSGFLVARGGNGGAGGCCGDGGGGGGGRIAYQFRTLAASGTTLVNGGSSGIRDTGECSCGSGGASADATGAPGVVTKTLAATSTTSPATDVSFATATLNGTINPHETATTFHFDFGTTTGYGSQVPASDAFAASDNADHAVSTGVGGLAPNTTYHYRLVATDSMGFSTFGADVGFTTGAAPPPPPPPPVTHLTVQSSSASADSLAFARFTKFINLSAKNLPRNATVTVTCKTKKPKQQKKGCPYKRKVFHPGSKTKLNLHKPFKHKKVPVKAKITILVSAPGFIDKRLTFTIRASKRPKLTAQCVPAGGKATSCSKFL